MDRVTPDIRSRNMARIRDKNTKPELTVRRYLHTSGLRYRLHVPSLAGKPDLVFVRQRICLFVNGCFWHGCPHCADGGRTPKSNQAYWRQKIDGNVQRDRRHARQLQREGWKVLVVWACEISRPGTLVQLRKAIAKH